MKIFFKLLLIIVLVEPLPRYVVAAYNSDVQRALKARNMNDYGFIDMVAFCQKLSTDAILGSGRGTSAAKTSNIFVDSTQYKKYKMGFYNFLANITKITADELKRRPLFLKVDTQFNKLLDQAAAAGKSKFDSKPYMVACNAISAELVLNAQPTKEQLIAAQDTPKSSNKHSNNKLTNNIKSNSANRSHKQCLEARDYEGCMRVKSSGGSSAITADPCKGDMCEVKVSGKDSFGLPKPMGGWFYIKEDDKIYYLTKVYAVPHKGQRARYVGMKRITRYYQNAEAGTSGQYLGFGDNTATTNCTEYNNSINCSTTGSRRIYIPGEEGTPGGVRSISFYSVYDCKDNTYASYQGGRLMYGGWKKTRTGWATPLVKACEMGPNHIKRLKTLNVKM